MKFKYVGPHDQIDLIGSGTVSRGGVVDVVGPVAASLAEQGDWQRIAAPKPRRTKTKTKPATGKNGPAAEKTEE